MTPAKKRGSINLTALGSAAVVAVYAAGYMRTRSAAQRFEERGAPRRPAPAAAAPAPVVIDAAKLIDTIRKDSLRVASTPVAPKKKRQPVVAAADTGRRSETPAPAKDTAPATPAPTATATPTPTPTPTATDSAKVLKDGIYGGWGSSRHGDIEAAVEIRDGKIVKAIITQCLTRYSCSRIAAIIPQVVERQSAEVDFVSGATESTNAFYYAILGALAKAK
jgi:uncharacterized protein with FMN-binding domain